MSLPLTEASGVDDLVSMDAAGMVAAFLRSAAAIPAALEPEQPAIERAIEAIAARLAQGGRLILTGAGTSGRLASMQAFEVAPTFGLDGDVVRAVVAEEVVAGDAPAVDLIDAAEDDHEAARRGLHELGLGPRDAVVGIAASGRTPFTLTALEAAAACGALTVSIACDHPTPMAAVAAIAIHPLVGPELLAGSTRLGAGTATKIVLDALTTSVMSLLGHVYRGRMIDMRVGNTKIRGRAVRTVSDLTGRGEQEALAALESVGWWVRAAIVALELGLDPASAIRRAREHRFLEDALVHE